MGFQREATYVVTMYARNPVHTQREGNARVEERRQRRPAALRVELEDADGRTLVDR